MKFKLQHGHKKFSVRRTRTDGNTVLLLRTDAASVCTLRVPSKITDKPAQPKRFHVWIRTRDILTDVTLPCNLTALVKLTEDFTAHDYYSVLS